MEEKTALLGFHNEADETIYKSLFEEQGYSVSSFAIPEKMLEEARKKEYRWYVMDANLGYSMTTNFTFAYEIQKLIKERLQTKNAKFFTLSFDPDIVEEAKEKGLPGMLKNVFQRLLEDNIEALATKDFNKNHKRGRSD